MVDDDSLAEVLSEFARTLLTDFPIQAILEHLVERIVVLLPIDAAGVTLIRPSQAPRYVAASDESALRFERLQTELGQGPCLAAFESGDAVAVPDLRSASRFPQFAPAAVAAGLAAVFTFPLRHGPGRLGALDLYRQTPGALGDREMRVAQTLADVTTAYLLNAQARDEARAASDHFHHNALHDPLTGLANRALLQERLQHAASRAHRSHTIAAVLFADLDRFKLVNDIHGHQTGDELLVAVARRLSGLIRPGDTLARLSGDEFVFLCEDLHSTADAEILASRVTAAFTDRFVIAGISHTVTASVGIAFTGPGEEISDQLIAHADLAMYQAKRAGGDRHHVIDLPQVLETRDHDSLEQDLHATLIGDDPAGVGLDVFYQPIVATADEQITGVEALLRWTHPDRGPIPALTTVELAERSHLIDTLGAWVLRRSCAAHARWRQHHPGTVLDLAVNVSGRELTTPGYSAAVTATLTETGMDPARLILEITESCAVEDDDQLRTVLGDLAAQGTRIALDDFGTGYSSLSHLRQLPVHIVKIDRSFTADLSHAARGAAMVPAITGLAHTLGLTVIAEGVQTPEHHHHIRSAGCEAGQGFHYARPMTAAAIDTYLDIPPRRPHVVA